MRVEEVEWNVRIYNLETVRFLAAIVVFFSHGGAPPLPGIEKGSLTDIIYTSLFNGEGAVMIFFVISGFCIHLPQTKSKMIELPAYAIKRIFRIAIPLAVASILLFASDLLAGSSSGRWFWQGYYFYGLTSVAWSLIAEIAYYAFYPAILWIASRTGFKVVLGLSIIGSLAIGIYTPHRNFWQYNLWAMALAGLPLWLTGCVLAETGIRSEKLTFELLAWRISVVLYLILSNFLLKFTDVQVSSSLVYLPFSYIIYQWLIRELTYDSGRSSYILEWAGKSSYSFYMLHKSVLWAQDAYLAPLVGNFWLLKVFIVLTASYAFAYTVEWPCHRLGYALALSLRQKRMTHVLPVAK